MLLDRLKAAGVSRTWSLALLSRVPLGAVGLLLVLQVRHLGHSYALAGASSGACALGMAVGAPILGRLVDRGGQRRVLAASGAVVGVAALAFTLLSARSPAPLFPLVALIIGLSVPPVSACARALWRRMLDRAAFGTVVTLDASLQELAFLAGPLLLVGLAQVVGAEAMLIVAGGLFTSCACAYALLPETRHFGHPASAAAQPSTEVRVERPWQVAGVRLLLLVSTVMGVAFGAIELGVVASAEHHHASEATGALLALVGAGSFTGGVLWSRRHRGGRHDGQALCWLLVGMGVFSAPLGFLPSIWALAPALFLAGTGIAPIFGLTYTLMADVAPATSITETFTLQSSAITAGLALGAALAGALAALGPPATFLVATVAFALGAAGQGVWHGVLTPSGPQAPPVEP